MTGSNSTLTPRNAKDLAKIGLRVEWVTRPISLKVASTQVEKCKGELSKVKEKIAKGTKTVA